MAEDPTDGIRVELRRRTLPEQIEYLVFQVGILVARVNTLERECEDLHARLKSVERATPLQPPKKPLPKKPWARGV